MVLICPCLLITHCENIHTKQKVDIIYKLTVFLNPVDNVIFFLFSFFFPPSKSDRFYLKYSLESRYVSRTSCSEFKILVYHLWISSLDCSNVCLSKWRKTLPKVERASCDMLSFQISRELQYSSIEKEM